MNNNNAKGEKQSRNEKPYVYDYIYYDQYLKTLLYKKFNDNKNYQEEEFVEESDLIQDNDNDHDIEIYFSKQDLYETF